MKVIQFSAMSLSQFYDANERNQYKGVRIKDNQTGTVFVANGSRDFHSEEMEDVFDTVFTFNNSSSEYEEWDRYSTATPGDTTQQVDNWRVVSKRYRQEKLLEDASREPKPPQETSSLSRFLQKLAFFFTPKSLVVDNRILACTGYKELDIIE